MQVFDYASGLSLKRVPMAFRKLWQLLTILSLLSATLPTPGGTPSPKAQSLIKGRGRCETGF
jgi:hypothetical protein